MSAQQYNGNGTVAAFRTRLRNALLEFRSRERLTRDDLEHYRTQVFQPLRSEADELGLDWTEEHTTASKG